MRTVLTRIRARQRAGTAILPVLAAVSFVSALGLQAAGRTLAEQARLESIAGRLETRTVAVLIQASEPVPYVTTQPDAFTVLVDLQNVKSAGVSNRFGAMKQEAVAGVTVEDTTAADGAPMARVKIRLAHASTPRVKSERNVIRIDVDREVSPSVPSDATVQQLSKPNEAAGTSGALNAANTQAPPPAQAAQQAPAQEQKPQVQQGGVLAGKGGEAKQYSGAPISLDFTGADIRSVLRSFVDISGLNIIIDPAVQGTVDIALREVPWDQALDIILRSYSLAYIVDGNVVRIAKVDTLAEEEAKRRKLNEEQAMGGALDTLTRALSYANAEEVKGVLTRSAITKRGQVEVDKRSNMVIVSDLPAAMPAIIHIIDSMDKATPQVEIEARIVQTTRNFAQQLGVTWGFTGRMDPALGNTTGLAFPNSGSITGRTGTNAGTTPAAVNLPVANPAGAVGLAMGAVNGAFNLDVALSALEKAGKGRILSSPRVVAQNNFVARMMQGVQIPIQTIANNTVTVQFKDAALQLEVTPQITANGTVIMKIVVDNSSPDYTNMVNNIPPINTQKAETQVLIKDNETIVIGGIYTSQETSQQNRVPGLYRIPLLGWLFKKDDIAESANELLIFLTPRIIKG